MSQVEDEPVCGENGYRCEECTECARTTPCECGCGLLGGTCGENNSCINCGEQLEEFDMEKCWCCCQEEERVCEDDLEETEK